MFFLMFILYWSIVDLGAFLVAQLGKKLPAVQETWVWYLGWEDPLEKEMATDSSILDWRISWTEGPSGPATVHGIARVGHDLATKPPPLLIHNVGLVSGVQQSHSVICVHMSVLFRFFSHIGY